jgi:hypothetical protein
MKIRPVYLPALNEALRPFYGSHHGKALMINSIFMVLVQVDKFQRPGSMIPDPNYIRACGKSA